ncbi:MAG: hypothetical protein LC114_11885 [Bryobacterales bacterium]|nr:hypothetical protein [Bryobacterales bacterium]
MIRIRVCILRALAALAVTCAALAQVPPPSVTVAGQKQTFAPPVAFFDAGNARVSLLYTPKPVDPDNEAIHRAKGTWEDLAFIESPAVVVDLVYTPGNTSGLVNALKSCTISSTGFKRDLELEGENGKECHIVSVGGMLRPNGGIAGLISGKGEQYEVYLPFAVTLWGGGAESSDSAPPEAGPPPSIALNTVKGTGTYSGQTVPMTHAIALWFKEKEALTVDFFDHAPSTGMVAASRERSWGEESPIATLEVRFDGAGRDLGSVDYCYFNVTFPKDGPIGKNTNAKGCGLTAFVTDAKPGGTALAVMKGGMDGPNGPIQWDLQFHVPIVK